MVDDGGLLLKTEQIDRTQAPHRFGSAAPNSDTFVQWQQWPPGNVPTDKVGRIFLLRGIDWSEGARCSC
eukprot:419061-Pyramimonas_sp.AAC.1